MMLLVHRSPTRKKKRRQSLGAELNVKKKIPLKCDKGKDKKDNVGRLNV